LNKVLNNNFQNTWKIIITELKKLFENKKKFRKRIV